MTTTMSIALIPHMIMAMNTRMGTTITTMTM
jgi:hypothetical protein